ncbi:DUF4381 domain-containing protein [Enterovibrio paralichthyis]|uniref:DUF4381 domain-containing protein n=1 Tax=Enterovibrio paralichthyis TaxID=2853805 RepID=UPI001C46E95B|nr:DUF4381 domain-containing protein [Enterovibrio paralichthyis]MBV7300137.1 DUF4381 domain-containing protein [Enterovibrio paralichthyis]
MANSVSTPALPLADIHLQQAPGLWPLAWGWWLVIAAVLIALLLTVHWLRLRNYRLAARQEALSALNAATSVADINALLKRAALSYYPREQVAGLTGERWLAFLDSQLPAAQQGFGSESALWLNGAFSNVPNTDAELAQAKAMAARWLKQAIPAKAQSVPSSSKAEARHV